ncbi:MAG: hydrogenase maturation protease [Gammaproteobacteria bacterium]
MTLQVIGIGSHAGDDQIGWLVVRRLQQRHPDIPCIQCDSPMALLGHLPLDGPLLVVDGVRSDRPEGTLHYLRWPMDPCPPGWGQPFSSHGLGLGDALALADRLGLLPSPTLLWGIEIGQSAPEEPVSPPVLAAVDQLTLAFDRLLAADHAPEPG